MRCMMCGQETALCEATSKTVDDLSDPFVVRCSHCRSQALVAKRDIETADPSSGRPARSG